MAVPNWLIQALQGGVDLADRLGDPVRSGIAGIKNLDPAMMGKGWMSMVGNAPRYHGEDMMRDMGAGNPGQPLAPWQQALATVGGDFVLNPLTLGAGALAGIGALRYMRGAPQLAEAASGAGQIGLDTMKYLKPPGV